MSLVEPWSPVPVLSPTRQLAGTPARRRAPPVVLARSHCVSWLREEAERALPSRSELRFASMAEGVVVSRGSLGRDWLRAVSMRSMRVTVSPRERANRVKPAGPPMLARMRLAAVLSL